MTDTLIYPANIPTVIDTTLSKQISIEDKKKQLDTIRAELKVEFFGIDSCIDAIIDSIKTWYLLPEIVMRPVIVNLWGLTGVGKTALVRSLVSKLNMSTQYVEIQMDGFSNGSEGSKSVCDILKQSSIAEGQQGIVLFDEFQRFRTVDEKGYDVKVERYADVWMLLSDGKLPSDFTQLVKMQERYDIWEYYDDMIAANNAEHEAESEEEPTAKKYYRTLKYKRKYYLEHRDACILKSVLRLKESIRDIMTWTKDRSREVVRNAVEAKSVPPIDYTKCLIFVSGNLDEAFQMSKNVEDCDTNADVFHDHTKKISVIHIKDALSSRFRPEQIARLGNNHVIYPSLSQSAYMSLIRRTCLEYADYAQKFCGITFEVDEDIYAEIYDNAVYPTQGTRPVFTSIHKMFGSPLSDAVLWAREIGSHTIRIGLDVNQSSLIFSSNKQKKLVKIDFDIRTRRAKRSDDFNALVAVHEAGHAVVYAELFKMPPVEVAINVASFNGGYNLFKSVSPSKAEILNQIAVSMAGIVAEELVFGQELRSSGCESDVNKATESAAKYVRRYAMDGFVSMTAPSLSGLLRSDFESTDASIETLIKDQKERAQTLLTKHRNFLIVLSKELMKVRKMDAVTFQSFARDNIEGLAKLDSNKDVNGDYFTRLEMA